MSQNKLNHSIELCALSPRPFRSRILTDAAQLGFQSARRCFLLLPALLVISLKVVKKIHLMSLAPALAERKCRVFLVPPSLLRPLDHKHSNFNASLGFTAGVVRPGLDIFEKFLP